MKSKGFKIDTRVVVAVLIVAMAVLVRVLTSGKIPNFAPIGALALFAGAYFRNIKTAFIIPVTALLISDLILGLHSTMIFVYGSFLMIILMSRYFNLNHNKSVGRVVGSTLLASVLFFLVTNLGVWMLSGMYDLNISGLMTSYAAGLPFFRHSLMGDLFYTAIFFGVYEGITHFILGSLKTA